MKHVLLLSSILLAVGGCSLSADTPPLAEQSYDLLDDDSDGVINARDLCDETPITAVIDNDGCPTYVLLASDNSIRVQFANDSAIVEPPYIEALDKMAQFLNLYPETTLELQGHTSSPGTEDYNQALSVRRAEAVKALLIERGAPEERVNIIGLGEGALMLPDSTETTQLVNRRVVGRVNGFKGEFEEAWTIFTQRNQ